MNTQTKYQIKDTTIKKHLKLNQNLKLKKKKTKTQLIKNHQETNQSKRTPVDVFH